MRTLPKNILSIAAGAGRVAQGKPLGVRRRAIINHLRDEAGLDDSDPQSWMQIMDAFPGPTPAEVNAQTIAEFLDQIHDMHRETASLDMRTVISSLDDSPGGGPLQPTDGGTRLVHSLGKKSVTGDDAIASSTLTIDLTQIPDYTNAVLWLNTAGGKVLRLTSLAAGRNQTRKLDTGIGGFVPASLLDIDQENDGPSAIPRGIYLGDLNKNDVTMVITVDAGPSSADYEWEAILTANGKWDRNELRAGVRPRHV